MHIPHSKNDIIRYQVRKWFKPKHTIDAGLDFIGEYENLMFEKHIKSFIDAIVSRFDLENLEELKKEVF
jgi:hypothetical protein